MFQYKAVITNVVDGDTFDMDIDLGFNIHIHERVRLLDIDTPEKFGEEKQLGLAVKRYAEQNFLHKEVVIRSEKAGEEANTDSFGRWLVHVTVDGENDICEIYNSMGVNKKHHTYNEENVLKLIAQQGGSGWQKKLHGMYTGTTSTVEKLKSKTSSTIGSLKKTCRQISESAKAKVNSQNGSEKI